jgi:hypothetical protein
MTKFGGAFRQVSDSWSAAPPNYFFSRNAELRGPTFSPAESAGLRSRLASSPTLSEVADLPSGLLWPSRGTIIGQVKNGFSTELILHEIAFQPAKFSVSPADLKALKLADVPVRSLRRCWMRSRCFGASANLE